MTPARVGIICQSLRKNIGGHAASCVRVASQICRCAIVSRRAARACGSADYADASRAFKQTTRRQMNSVSATRRRFSQSLLLASAAPQVAAAHCAGQAARTKVLRYAFRVAETGFDPAQVNDIYSSNVNANISTHR